MPDENHNKDIALALAAADIPVFPCRPDKTPLCKWRDCSTCDEAIITAWWNAHPDALPGIDLGKVGLVALDGDRHGGPDGRTALRKLIQKAGVSPHTIPMVLTPGDGVHCYFRQNGTVIGNRTGDLPKGIDVRGTGGYTIGPSAKLADGRAYKAAPGSPGLIEAFASGAIPYLPAAIVELIGASHQTEISHEPGSDPVSLFSAGGAGIREQAYGATAMDGCVAELAIALSGERNHKANAIAFRLGRMVARGWVERETVLRLLLDAMHANGSVADDGDAAAIATLKSGLEGGLKHPHDDLPERNINAPHVGGAPIGQQSEPPDVAGVCLSVREWLARDIPPPDFLLGEVLHTTSRALLVAPTGLGKTNFCMALGFSMAAGQDFLRWHVPRPARVLFVDGEMSRRLVKIRLAEASQRLGTTPEPFFMLCRDDVPELPPLNTAPGQAFIEGVIATKCGGSLDLIIFDNTMALLSGDMKDEEGWSQTLPWAKTLTKRSIGQLWVHHTGHDQSRSYGTSTREWQKDTVVLMEAIERPGADIAFSLKFTKARERAPHNRLDFEPLVITLDQDRWDCEIGAAEAAKKKPSPKGLTFHRALVAALATVGMVRRESVKQVSVTTAEWQAECLRMGLLDGDAPLNQTRALFSKYKLELISLRWAVCDGNLIWKGRGAI